MSNQEKTVDLLSRAEVTLAGAEDILMEKELASIAGQVSAINLILRIVRKESIASHI